MLKIEEELKTENIWSNQELSSKLLKEQKELKSALENLSSWNNVLEDSLVALELEDLTLLEETKNDLMQTLLSKSENASVNLINAEYFGFNGRLR